MIKYIKILVLTLTYSIAFAGCSSTGIVNKEVHSVVTDLNGSYKVADVGKAIAQGAEKRKWTVINLENNKMRATYMRQGHKVVVDITYTGKKITIDYVDSENMYYQLKNGVPTIHNNYHRWVNNIGNDARKILGEK